MFKSAMLFTQFYYIFYSNLNRNLLISLRTNQCNRLFIILLYVCFLFFMID